MKRWLCICLALLSLCLAGCTEAEPTDAAQTVPATEEATVATEAMATETAAVETTVPEETVPAETEIYRYPSRRTVNGREVYDFGMELFNDTESALTVLSMQVTDYVSGEKVAEKSYSGWELDVFNGDRPAKYTMQPGYPIVLFMEEDVAAVTFDSREITVQLQSETGEETQRVFSFQVDDEQAALRPDPEAAEWVPAILENSGWRFPCTVTNDTDQVLTLTGMYSLQYINSNAVRFAYRNAKDSYISEIATLQPEESATWTDGISEQNMFATHRKYVIYYEDPQGNVYENTFRFVAEKES